MAAKPFNPKDLENMQNFLELQEKLAENMRKSTLSFAKAAREAGKAKKDAEAAQKRVNNLEEEQRRLEADMLKMSGEELELAKARFNLLQDEVEQQKEIVEQNKALEAALKRQTKSLKNISIAVGRDIASGTKKVLGYVKDLSLEYFKQDGQIRRTAVNIGLMGKQQEQFRKTVYKSALATQRLGMDAAAVAESYSSYVDAVGRLIPLTDKAAYAMSEMAMGTALGKEGAAQMAASMEVFGMSIESTAGYVEDVANMSEKMGVNSGKVLKDLSQNLRKAQTVRFKGGVEGMAKMAAKATKIRMDMGTALGFAQDLWEPEKAIETAASLQMMGGAFAKMGDPIRLMFLGRNDPAKLMEELSTAASSVVKNMGNGTYDIPTMELQKLKQVAEQTGVPFEELVETAKTVAKQKDIGRMLSPKIDKEGQEFLTSIAEYSEKEGGFVVSVGGDVKKLSQLSQDQVKAMMTESKTLEERAKSAQDLMSLFSNLFSSFKNLASSFFAGMEETLRPSIDELIKTISGDGKGGLGDFAESLTAMGESVGTYLASFITALPEYIEWMKKIPEKVGDFFGAFIDWSGWDTLKSIGEGIMKAGTFIYNLAHTIKSALGLKGTLMLGLGLLFRKQITGMLGGLLGGGQKGTYGNPMITQDIGGGGGMGDVLKGRGKGKVGRMVAKVFGRKAASGIGGRIIGGLTKGIARGGPLALLGAGLDIGRSFMDDPDTGFGKAMGIGSSTAMGASIGSILLPGIGTAVGGLIGGIYGAVNEFSKKTTKDIDTGKISSEVSSITSRSVGGASTSLADGQIAPGSGAVISTKKGKFFTDKKDYITASTNNPLAGGGGGEIKEVSVGGTIKLDAGGANVTDLMKDSEFRREVVKMVANGFKFQNR